MGSAVGTRGMGMGLGSIGKEEDGARSWAVWFSSGGHRPVSSGGVQRIKAVKVNCSPALVLFLLAGSEEG